MSIEVFASVEICELSLDPEVATLFGREIGQSNGDVLLTGDEPARIKVEKCIFCLKCLFITFTFDERLFL
jgi:hypothetical protein